MYLHYLSKKGMIILRFSRKDNHSLFFKFSLIRRLNVQGRLSVQSFIKLYMHKTYIILSIKLNSSPSAH